MKRTPWLCAFLLFTISTSFVSAQTWRYTLGWSANCTYGKIDGEKVLHPNPYSMLKTTPGLSVTWPLSKDITGMSAAENILRLGVFTLGIERRMNNRWTVISGLEAGGRLVQYKEYAQDGRGEGTSEEYLANSAKRSFVVCSVPLLMKYKLYANKIDYSLLGGIYLNEAFSKSKVTPFYTTADAFLFYPSLSAGFRIGSAQSKGFAIECAYQYGLSEAVVDQISVGSSVVVNQPVSHVAAVSKGSHFRVGVLYGLSFEQQKHQKKRSSGYVPYEERGVGKTIRIKTVSDTFRICFEDNKTADADSIRIVFNHSGEAQLLELLDSAQCLDFDVHRRLSNTIDIYMVNEGKIKPNTMLLRYTDSKNKKRVLEVNNGMKDFVRIRVIYLK